MKEQHMQGMPTPYLWTCPRCGRANGSDVVCPTCGFDKSTNYLDYPTLVEVPQRNAPRWTEEEQNQIEAEVQHRLEKERAKRG